MSEQCCPDDGRCHHDCGEGPCYRVLACAPLTAYGEDWSDEDKRDHEELRLDLAAQIQANRVLKSALPDTDLMRRMAEAERVEQLWRAEWEQISDIAGDLNRRLQQAILQIENLEREVERYHEMEGELYKRGQRVRVLEDALQHVINNAETLPMNKRNSGERASELYHIYGSVIRYAHMRLDPTWHPPFEHQR